MLGESIAKLLAVVLILVGALNWGYIAYTGNCSDDLVNAIAPGYARPIYAAVGISGVVLAVLIYFRNAYGIMDSMSSTMKKTAKSARSVVVGVRR